MRSVQRDTGSIVLLDLTCLSQDQSAMIDLSSSELTSHVSGVILDPIDGFEAVAKKDNGCGLALSLVEASGPALPTELPTFFPNWGVEFVRHNYGLAYLKLQYHPNEPVGADKMGLVAEVYDHCLYEGIELILEISLFALNDQKNTLDEFQEAQLLAVQDFRDKCHAMVLEYPHSALACATLTAELDVPWLLADRTPNYSEFKEQVRVAIESGAVGTSLGQVIWQGLEIGDYEKFITTTARDRVIEISRIVDELMAKESAQMLSL